MILKKIIPDENQLAILYELLNTRKHRISHRTRPSYEQHENFAAKHPYRAWYIVNINSKAVGSVCVSNQNTIGINVERDLNEHLVSTILQFINSEYEPLDPIASVRSGVFAVNVPASNRSFSETLENLGAELAQVTY